MHGKNSNNFVIVVIRVLVLNKMEEIYQTCNFHDSAELNQATQFLHENGILLHYDDINLQNVYFLDPQWLCDVLANVVTIREINSLAKCGRYWCTPICIWQSFFFNCGAYPNASHFLNHNAAEELNCLNYNYNVIVEYFDLTG